MKIEQISWSDIAPVWRFQCKPLELPVFLSLFLLCLTLYTTKPAKAKTPANNVAASMILWSYLSLVFLLGLLEPPELPVFLGLFLLCLTLYTTKPAKAKTPANANNVAASMIISLLFFVYATVR